MNINFLDQSLRHYSDQLAERQPVPGGGSASALTSALGASLISMVTRYSIGKNSSKSIEQKLQKTLKTSEQIRQRLLELVELDSQAYLNVVANRKADAKSRNRAAREARKVPEEICKLNYKAMELLPFLVQNGNRYLVSDVQVAAELLLSGFKSAKIMVEANS